LTDGSALAGVRRPSEHRKSDSDGRSVRSRPHAFEAEAGGAFAEGFHRGAEAAARPADLAAEAGVSSPCAARAFKHCPSPGCTLRQVLERCS